MAVGNYEQARRDFQDAQAGTTEPEVQAAAALGMGQALYMGHYYSNAINTLENNDRRAPKEHTYRQRLLLFGQEPGCAKDL